MGFKIGVGGKVGPVRAGVSNRGVGGGVGPLSVGYSYRRRGGTTGTELLIGLVVAAFWLAVVIWGLILAVAWPPIVTVAINHWVTGGKGGTSVAVVISGVICEVLWLRLLIPWTLRRYRTRQAIREGREAAQSALFAPVPGPSIASHHGPSGRRLAAVSFAEPLPKEDVGAFVHAMGHRISVDPGNLPGWRQHDLWIERGSPTTSVITTADGSFQQVTVPGSLENGSQALREAVRHQFGNVMVDCLLLRVVPGGAGLTAF